MVTGSAMPSEAAAAVLEAPGTATRWCVIKLGIGGAILFQRDSPPAWCPALQARLPSLQAVSF